MMLNETHSLGAYARKRDRYLRNEDQLNAGQSSLIECTSA